MQGREFWDRTIDSRKMQNSASLAFTTCRKLFQVVWQSELSISKLTCFFFMGVFFIGQALLGSGCGSLQHRHQLLWEKLSVVSKSESLAGAALAPGPPLLPGFFPSAGEDSCNWLVDWLIGWLFFTCLILSYLVWDEHNWLALCRTMYYYSVLGFKFVYWLLNFPVLALRSSQVDGRICGFLWSGDRKLWKVLAVAVGGANFLCHAGVQAGSKCDLISFGNPVHRVTMGNPRPRKVWQIWSNGCHMGHWRYRYGCLNPSDCCWFRIPIFACWI